MSPRPLPTLETLSRRLARGTRRVGLVIDQRPTLVDELMAAWERRDRRALADLSQQLVEAAATERLLAEVADQLQRSVQSEAPLATQRAMLQLIGRTGELRRRGMLPAALLPAGKRCS
jgi:hypothetical protein